MKLVIDIPDGYVSDGYNLNDIQNGSIACSIILKAVKNGKPYEERPLYIEDVFRLVAGHNIYSGDSILSAFTCLSEGKDVKDITSLDITYAEIASLRQEAHNEETNL